MFDLYTNMRLRCIWPTLALALCCTGLGFSWPDPLHAQNLTKQHHAPQDLQDRLNRSVAATRALKWPDPIWPKNPLHPRHPDEVTKFGNFLFDAYGGFALRTTNNHMLTPSTQTSTQSEDLLNVVTLGGQLKSDWSRHSFKFMMNIDQAWHQDHKESDFSDVLLGLHGRADINPSLSVLAGFDIESRHVALSDDNIQANAAEPDVYGASKQHFGVTGRLSPTLRAEGTFNAKTYEFDLIKLKDGSKAAHSARDRSRSDLRGRLYVTSSPAIDLFFGIGTQSIEHSLASSQLRDAKANTIEAGLIFNVNQILKSEVSALFESWKFSNSNFRSQSVNGVAAAVDYRIGERLRAEFNADKILLATSVSNAQARIDSHYDLTLSWRLTRRVTLSPFIGLGYTEYVFTDRTTARNYDDTTVGLRASYQLFPKFRLFSVYSNDVRRATLGSRGYSEAGLTIGGLASF